MKKFNTNYDFEKSHIYLNRGRLRKRKIKHAKPVAAVAMA